MLLPARASSDTFLAAVEEEDDGFDPDHSHDYDHERDHDRGHDNDARWSCPRSA